MEPKTNTIFKCESNYEISWSSDNNNFLNKTTKHDPYVSPHYRSELYLYNISNDNIGRFKCSEGSKDIKS